MMENKKVPFGRRLVFSAASSTLSSPKAFRLMEKVSYNMLQILPEALLKNSTLDPWVAHREIPSVKKETFRDWYLKNKKENEH